MAISVNVSFGIALLAVVIGIVALVLTIVWKADNNVFSLRNV